MYAIVKTGGKQYKVAPGDKISIERIDAEAGAQVELPVICVVDGATVEADPAKAAATKVLATVLEEYRDKKQLVFKFKKRKNYKKLRGHRQTLTRVRIDAVGSEKAPAPKKAAPKKAAEDAKAEKPATSKKAAEGKAGDKKPAAKKPAAKKADAPAEKKAAEKKPAAKKTAAKKDEGAKDSAKADE